MKFPIFFILLFAAYWSSNATDTNTIYVTDEGFLSINYSEKVKEARESKESLPAEDFPEGNWGAITNGFQLSLRFDKQVFTNGEPMFANILLRNTTNQIRTYTVSLSSVANRSEPIGLSVFSETGAGISPTSASDDNVIVSTRGRSLIPKTQHKYTERLDKIYDFKTNGSYFAQAALTVFCPNRITITSAKVPIKIIMHP
jgi:hypothetical protein